MSIYREGKSARQKWCGNWTPDSKKFKFGDWRDKTESAERAFFNERHNIKQGGNNGSN